MKMLDIREYFVSSKSNQIFFLYATYIFKRLAIMDPHHFPSFTRYYSTAAKVKRMPSNGKKRILDRVLAIEETWHPIQNILKNNNLDFLLRGEELFGRYIVDKTFHSRSILQLSSNYLSLKKNK